MTIATALFASLVCVCMCAAAQKNAAPVFACNLKTISSAERLRYDVLVKRIRGAMRGRMETSNGYVFKLDSKMVTLPEAAEWMGMERLCCPFLTLQLAASGNQAAWRYDAHRPRRREILSSTPSFRHVELAMPS